MTYVESEKRLNEIRNKNGVLFRMALSHMMDVGIRHLTKENVANTCKEIDKEDDSHHFMTNAYKKEILKTAYELAQIDHIHILVYAQRHMTYDIGDGINIENILNSLDVLLDDLFYERESNSIYAELTDAGLSDEEIGYLGYDWVVPDPDVEDD